MDQLWLTEHWAFWWVMANFLIYLTVFVVALCINSNFNIIMVGMIYLAPLIPVGWETAIGPRFVMQSIHNTVFGVIELVIFVITVKPADATFDRAHVKQLLGHTLPIAAALIGLSYVSRVSSVSLSPLEAFIIMTVFLVGSILRVMAVYQLGSQAFKFDIVFRDQQTLRTEKAVRVDSSSLLYSDDDRHFGVRVDDASLAGWRIGIDLCLVWVSISDSS